LYVLGWQLFHVKTMHMPGLELVVALLAVNYLVCMVSQELSIGLDLLLAKLYNYGAVGEILFSRETLRRVLGA